MSLGIRTALLASALALLAVPAAFAAGPPITPGPPANEGTATAAAHRSASAQPGPSASLPANAKAYGRYCSTQSKTRVEGQKGTPFSQCVTAMAKLATGATSSPKAACAALSKTRLDGQKGTPFSQCVASGAKLLNEQE